MSNNLPSHITEHEKAKQKLELFSKWDTYDLQKQFEELKGKLHASHQTLEKIIAYMSDGLIFVAEDGIITIMNGAAEEIFGLSSDLLIQSHYEEYFPDFFFGFSLRSALKESIAPKRIFLTLNGDKEIEVSASSIPNKGILLLIRNRGDHKKMEAGEEVAERLEELGFMAATLAHEIRNPLGGITGFAELLNRSLENPSLKRMTGAILEGANEIERMIAQVLDYARPLNLHFAPDDLVSLIEESIEFANASHQFAPISFTTFFKSYPICLDRLHMRQVIFNLLRNASEAGASKISIHLDGFGLLHIKDNGAGISTQDLRKIFTPFFTTKAKGTGLGLAHSLAIVKGHGGTLDVTSTEGKGTEFILGIKHEH